jgi:hypothetical protein
MRKIAFLICIILLFSTHSCGLFFQSSDKREYVSVEIINQTMEDMNIYRHDDVTWLIRINEHMIKSNESAVTIMRTSTTYSAEGYISRKEYGTFSVPSSSSIPSKIDVPSLKYTWIIKE